MGGANVIIATDVGVADVGTVTKPSNNNSLMFISSPNAATGQSCKLIDD